MTSNGKSILTAILCLAASSWGIGNAGALFLLAALASMVILRSDLRTAMPRGSLRRRKSPCYGIQHEILYVFVLLPLRAALEIARWVYTYLFCPCPLAIASDGVPVLVGLRVCRRVAYGRLDRERLDVLLPDPTRQSHPGCMRALRNVFVNDDLPDTSVSGLSTAIHAASRSSPRKVAVVFVHGGGWVIPGSEVQFQQLTPWARQGHVVYTVNYPLAPEHRFPTQVLSLLRALRFIKAVGGHDRVVLVGESAGGNLCSMAAALLANPEKLMVPFSRDPVVGKCLDTMREEEKLLPATWAYPEIAGFSSWYSILDKTAWQQGGGAVFGLQLQPGRSVFTRGLELCFDWYASQDDDDGGDGDGDGDAAAFRGRLTLADVEHGLDAFPPMQMIIAENDPTGLGFSSRAVARMLRRKGHCVEVLSFKATHGFVAYPPQSQQWLFGIDTEATQLPAAQAVLKFLSSASTRRRKGGE